MTPAWFDCLYLTAIQHQHKPTAQLAALYVNAHREKNERPITAEAFIPGMPDDSELTEEQIRLMNEEGIIPDFDLDAFKASFRGTASDPDHQPDNPECRCQWCLKRQPTTKQGV